MYGASFNIGEIESYLRKITLDSEDYNIVEFILEHPSYYEYVKAGEDNTLGDVEYLVEDPEREFEEYVTSMRAEDLKWQNLDPNLLAKIFANVLRGEGDHVI